ASLTKAGLLTDRSSQTGGLPISGETVAITCRSARCSQWRDRAGFTPASLFTLPRKEENLGIVYGYHIGVPRVNEILRPKFCRRSRKRPQGPLILAEENPTAAR